MRMIAVASFLMVVAACRVQTPVEVGVVEGGIPKDSGNRCASLCSSIGFSLDAVVVMAHNVGCVCRAPSATGTPAASASAGMTTIMLQAQAEQEADADRRRIRRDAE